MIHSIPAAESACATHVTLLPAVLYSRYQKHLNKGQQLPLQKLNVHFFLHKIKSKAWNKRALERVTGVASWCRNTYSIRIFLLAGFFIFKQKKETASIKGVTLCSSGWLTWRLVAFREGRPQKKKRKKNKKHKTAAAGSVSVSLGLTSHSHGDSAVI